MLHNIEITKMTFQPNDITRTHVLGAIKKIEKEVIQLNSATRWYVEIEGKPYPSKEVMRYAHEQMNGEKIWKPGGGPETTSYLIKMGFNIIDKKLNAEIN